MCHCYQLIRILNIPQILRDSIYRSRSANEFTELDSEVMFSPMHGRISASADVRRVETAPPAMSPIMMNGDGGLFSPNDCSTPQRMKQKRHMVMELTPHYRAHTPWQPIVGHASPMTVEPPSISSPSPSQTVNSNHFFDPPASPDICLDSNERDAHHMVVISQQVN